jgi:hypothetical protein
VGCELRCEVEGTVEGVSIETNVQGYTDGIVSWQCWQRACSWRLCTVPFATHDSFIHFCRHASVNHLLLTAHDTVGDTLL